MRQITTSKGETYNVETAWAPMQDGSCVIVLTDPRPLYLVAESFDGLESIHYIDSTTGEYDFVGYSKLTEISIDQAHGTIFLRLVKPVKEDNNVD